eukprot:gene10039-10195_t
MNLCASRKLPAGNSTCAYSRATRSAVRTGFQAASRPEYVPNRIDDPNYVRIFDTTLRDGEQSPGATLTSQEKLEIARQLTKLGVDVIEAGFPVSSPADFEAVKRIACEVGNDVDERGYVPVICGMGRTTFADLDRTWEAVRHARRPRVHMVLATSDIHMKHKLKMTRDQVVENAIAAAKHLQEMGCYDIEFCAEDASRSDRDFLCQVLTEVIKAGATTLNIPDTVGWSMPHEYRDLITYVRTHTKGIENVVMSTHCHDDLGLSAANSLAGIMAGARQIECCVNGIGERAGNAALEQIVMTMALKGQEQMGGLYTAVNPIHIYPTSRMVSNYSGMIVQPHRSIVGANAFAHESGMHQDGILKHRETYEIMSPETIGLKRDPSKSGIVLGKLSGRRALSTRLEQLGFILSKPELNDVFARFKALADKKKIIDDEDLLQLVRGEAAEQPTGIWQLVGLQVTHGTSGLSTCSVELKGLDAIRHVAEAEGTGPIDATFKAIDFLVRVPVELTDYSVNSLTEGSQAPVTCRVSVVPLDADYRKKHEEKKRVFAAQCSDEDIVVSSARAYLIALNKMIAALDIPVAMAATGAADDIITRAMSRNMIHLRSLAQASKGSLSSMSISSSDGSNSGDDLLTAISTSDGVNAANLGFTGYGAAAGIGKDEAPGNGDAATATGRPRTRKGTESSELFTAV